MSSEPKYRGKLPFDIVESCVTTGYNKNVVSSTSQSIEIVNLHTDEYAHLEDSPLQGPFTETWAGGHQHRHTPLNLGNDNEQNRAEAFLIELTPNTVKVFGPTHFDPLRPKAIYTRDNIAKSPLNIKNIKSRNLQVGNFNFNYEVVQTSGRSLNQSLIANDITASGMLTTKFIKGVEDYELPQIQDRTKSVIVERFSAPGDIKESSRGSLERNGEEFAPNNSLVTRNIKVRQSLYSQLKTHSQQFSGSIHGVNRNTINNIELSGTTFITASDYDNFWVQHAIPASDLRYKWIADSNTNIDLGTLIQYQSFAGTYNRNSAFTDITFNTSSLVKSGSNLEFEVNNSWINSIVKDKKTVNTDINTFSISSPKLSASFSEIVNSSYGFSSWVETRNGQHPVARALKNKNIFSLEGEKNIISNNRMLSSRRSNDVVNFKEPPVSIKFKPITEVLKLKTTDEPFKFIFTHENNLSTFTNNTIVDKLGINENSDQIYDMLLKQYTDVNIATNPQNSLSSLESIVYSQTAYPPESKTFLAQNRGRTAYILTQSGTTSRDQYGIQLGTQRVFWRDDLEDRKRASNESPYFYNSLKYSYIYNLANVKFYISGTAENFNLPNASSKKSSDLQYTSSFTGSGVYRQDSVLLFDNNDENNSTRYLADNVLAVKSDAIINKTIATKTIDNGCSGELNSEIFVDYFYVSGSNPASFGSQLLRVTPFTNYLQYSFKTGSMGEFSGSYYSYSNFILNPLFNKGKYYTTYSPRPNYVAFIGGFESGSRNYTTGSDKFDLSEYEFYNNKPTGQVLSTLDSGLRFISESYGDKKPWFDSYEEYEEDIRPLAKDHSIIPEFIISSNMPYYVKTKSGNFRSENKQFLQIDGAHKTSYRSAQSNIGSYDSYFVNSYVVSDDSNTAREIQNDNLNVAKLKEINFTISGIKKLLPYNGFYPKERTIQLANLFNDYMSNNVRGGWFNINSSSSGLEFVLNTGKIPDYFYKNTVMPYFFAPGILYNTIKSGISVNFPSINADLETFLNPVLENIESSTLSVASVTKDFVLSGTNIRLSYLADNIINSDIPFESLIFPDLGIPVKTNILENEYRFTFTNDTLLQSKTTINRILKDTLLNIKFDAFSSPDSFFHPTGSLTGMMGGGWKDSIPFAYLTNTEIRDPSYSMAMSNFLAEIPNFFLKEQLDGKHLNAFRSSDFRQWAPFNTSKEYYFDLVLKKSSTLVMLESYSGPNRVTGSSDLEKTMNGRYFGWPVNKTTSSLIDASVSEQYSAHNDPAYAPFTPPYFEGEAILRVKLKPTVEKYDSIKDFFKDLEFEDIFEDIRSSVGTECEAYKHKMSIQDCVQMLGIGESKIITYNQFGNPIEVRDPESATSLREYWTIFPKLETPVLDFSSNNFKEHTGSYWLSDGYGRGMWSGYGTIPDSSKGIVLQIRDSFPQNRQSRTNRPLDLQNTASLLTHIGIEPSAKRIGQIADSKTISEAIVAIPFVEQAIPNKTVSIQGFNFFKIDPFIYNMQKKNLKDGYPAVSKERNNSEQDYFETSISKTIKLMDEYVIPPNFNFNLYEDIEPFIMYMFEFKHVLDQQDLADIWQSVMPKIATQAKQETISFGHEINKYEFFGGFGDFEIPNNMRWLIFKVKKKAEANYYAITADIYDDSNFKFKFINGQAAKTPDYSYNWPYDYFSLVELAKVDISYTFKKPDTDNTG